MQYCLTKTANRVISFFVIETIVQMYDTDRILGIEKKDALSGIDVQIGNNTSINSKRNIYNLTRERATFNLVSS